MTAPAAHSGPTEPEATAHASSETADLEALLGAMEAMPASPSVAMQVLWLADNPESGAAELSSVLELDPSLTARVLRLANSAFYSPMARVTSVPRAVVTVGFSTIQALAVAASSGLENQSELPERFWEHSAQVAHATGLVARYFGVAANEAFAAGLLHDLGEGVMCRISPTTWSKVVSTTPPHSPQRLDAERQHYGTTHPEAAERILRAWHLPDQLCIAVGSHHRDPTTPLGRALVAGQLLAQQVLGESEPCDRAALSDMGVPSDFIDKVGCRLESESRALSEAFR